MEIDNKPYLIPPPLIENVTRGGNVCVNVTHMEIDNEPYLTPPLKI
jgi:hypothetical protein